MTRDQQIAELLQRLPRGAKGQVVNFLRTFSRNSSKKTRQRGVRRRASRVSVADRSFAFIPADSATIHQILSEDLYELE